LVVQPQKGYQSQPAGVIVTLRDKLSLPDVSMIKAKAKQNYKFLAANLTCELSALETHDGDLI
jgi:hypothetical protein